QEKARQIEMFAQRYTDVVLGIGNALEISNSTDILASSAIEQQLSNTLRDNPNLLALYLKPVNGESLSLFRPGAFVQGEFNTVISDIESRLNTQELLIGQPVKLSQNGDYAMTLASQVSVNDRTIASVIAVVSLKDISRSVVGTAPTSEAD